MTRTTIAALILATLAPPLAAQRPLTLTEALERADARGYRNRMAAGEVDGRLAQAAGALPGILPTIRVSVGPTRSNDPLNAFGMTLQQGGVTAAAFDPARLNDPEPVTNWNAGVTAEVPLFNADAWLGRRAALTAAEAERSAAGWTRESVRLDVIRAWFGAVLAAEQVRTLEAALEAADAHVGQAESMVRNGMATGSDALLARVERGRVEALLIGARAGVVIAHRQLAVLMGTPGDHAFSLPDSLPSSEAVARLATLPIDRSSERADLSAARLGLAAAEVDAKRVDSRYLPRINGFARYDWNSPDSPFGGSGRHTIGVMASWSPFDGAGTIAASRAAAAARTSAAAMAEAAEAAAALELASASSDLAVALARLEIAVVATQQSADAHRIVARKYAGELATVAELLSAAAVAREARLNEAAARYQVIVAAATLRLASGASLTELTVTEN